VETLNFKNIKTNNMTLIRKEEKNNTIKCVYESSNIILSEYDKNTNLLKIGFKNGSIYSYKDVPYTDYFKFEIDESQGKALRSYILQYEDKGKVDKIDPKQMLLEVDSAINNNFEENKQNFITSIKNIISLYDKDKTILREDLITLKTNIKTLLNEK
jgi:hypothetical protein